MELTPEEKNDLDVLIERFVRNTRFKPFFKQAYVYNEETLDAEIRLEVISAIENHYKNHPEEKIRNIEAFVVDVWNKWKMRKNTHFKTKQFGGWKGTIPMSLDVSSGQQSDEPEPQPFHTRITAENFYVPDTSGEHGGYTTRDGKTISATDTILFNAYGDSILAKQNKTPFKMNEEIQKRFLKISNINYTNKTIYNLRTEFENRVRPILLKNFPYLREIINEEEKKREEGKK